MGSSDNIYVIIVAAGVGSRFGAKMPKQYCLLDGIPVLMHTINQFRSALPNSDIRLVISREMDSFWKELCEKYNFQSPEIVYGGQSRIESVRNALLSLTDKGSKVLIHDGVRPLIDCITIKNVLKEVKSGIGVAPALNVTDSLRKVLESGQSVTVNRSEYKSIQTPQGFILSEIRSAYNTPSPEATDDLSVWENYGGETQLVQGSTDNIKITNPKDILIASILRGNSSVHQ